MRYPYPPTDDCDKRELDELNAEPWQIELLNLNPDYCSWGPHEDYMITKGEGWNSPVFCSSWDDFGPWSLDNFNEIVNFYFEIGRESKECETCKGTGYHPDALWVSESFYRHSSPFCAQTFDEARSKALLAQFSCDIDKRLGDCTSPPEVTLSKYGSAFREFCAEMKQYAAWHDRITGDEVNALWDAKRLHQWKGEKPTANEVNGAQSRNLNPHDAINRCILIRARCERFGIPVECPTCDSKGHVFTAEKAHASLVLWVIHPRKGCSRGVEIKHVQRGDLPQIKEFLTKAAARNAKRFQAVLSTPFPLSN